MNWGDWVDSDPKAALEQWKLAASGVSKAFKTAAGRAVRKEHPHEKEGAFWIEIREPLDGIRLLAFRLFRPGNTLGQMELCIFTYAQREDVWKRFERGERFSFNDVTFTQYSRSPQGTWKYELEKEKVTVHGVAFSGKLADIGEPQMAAGLLRALFDSFCAYVLERYAGSAVENPLTNITQTVVGTGLLSAAAATSTAADSESADDQQLVQFAESLMHLSASERDALVKARVGQSSFREKLLQRWSNSCCVTGLKNPEVLIASHIVPWSQCRTAGERWNVDNGLLLTPALDKAFELGYVSFEHERPYRGRMIVSARASWDLKDKLKLDNPQWRIREWHTGLEAFLVRHRQRWGL